MSMQDDFERAYSEDNGGLPVEFIKLARQGDSYNIPKIARAWYWWKRSRVALMVEWPDHYEYTNSDVAGAAILDCRTAFSKAAKVTP